MWSCKSLASVDGAYECFVAVVVEDEEEETAETEMESCGSGMTVDLTPGLMDCCGHGTNVGGFPTAWVPASCCSGCWFNTAAAAFSLANLIWCMGGGGGGGG